MRMRGLVFSLGVFFSAVAVAESLDIGALPLFDREAVTCGEDWLVAPCAQPAALYRTGNDSEFVLANGLLALTFRTAPNAARVGLDLLPTNTSVMRGVKPEARITLDGTAFDVGGLRGQPNHAYLLPEWVEMLKIDPLAMRFAGMESGPVESRMDWKQVRHHAPDAVWPPRGVQVRMDYVMPAMAKLKGVDKVRVSVYYALYDEMPAYSKWLTVENGGDAAVTLDTFTSELLAAVELNSDVEDRAGTAGTPNVHVETDYAFLSMSAMNAGRHAIRWVADPDYETQVNYARVNPCLLEVGPDLGPAAAIAPGETFTSFRAWVMPFDSTERERKGLAQRRMYRTIAPWSTENPLMMHVKLAIDQCAEVGFEMVILTFGSGFEVENTAPEYVAEMKRYADYAAEKGIELGGYSLLASRSIDAENDVVMPEGESPAFGNSPCIMSGWGDRYFDTLYSFYEATGFDLLEHDGSYPGDACASTAHPGHAGLADSRWTQWRRITDFYHWCRGRGIYLNVPDWYFLSGSNKTGMGYRETNWSLPRAQQVIHTRQNIYDGTWEKTPSMGWMFVPLTQYHGGGAAATIEPLDEHIAHYERMLVSNLALGVQACYRGPRLYDTDRVRDMVKDRVAWFKEHRNILESDVIHGRRADGRDLDWMLHVNPGLETKGMLVVFNPLTEPVSRTLEVNVYYTGIHAIAQVTGESGELLTRPVCRRYTISLPVYVPAEGFAWYALTGE
jgi:hypothetical protein